MISWVEEQARTLAGEWERAIDRFHPQRSTTWRDPEQHWHALMHEWNTFDAVSILDWRSLLEKPGIHVLDLGAGTGWLSAHLSRFAEVERIGALDSGVHNLRVMLPAVIRKLEGDATKIHPVLGFFSPLLVEDNHYDLIVASSAVHHASNLTTVLRECHRALKIGGALFVLNETPWSTLRYFHRCVRTFASILYALFRKDFTDDSPVISKSGILIDPSLGDYCHASYQWDNALRQSGFSYETIVSPYPSYKNTLKHQEKLTHFLCRKAASTTPAKSCVRLTP